MPMMLGLVIAPLVVGLMVAFVRSQRALAWIVRPGALCVLGLSVAFVATHFSQITTMRLSGAHMLKWGALVIELGLTAYIVRLGLRTRSFLLAGLSAAQFVVLLLIELGPGRALHTDASLRLDKLSLLMILITGVIGSLICIYAIEYMKDYHRNHPELPDRRYAFVAVLFVFLSAMFALLMCNDLTLLLFCWEITTFCSFLLIGNTQKPEAQRNARLALSINVGGGLAFAVALWILAAVYGVGDLEGVLSLDGAGGLSIVAVLLLAVAGMTKAAQAPFSHWLLGAMVAPTPSSAMLHSSTMVKAGVYLILRLSPVLGGHISGIVVTLVGGITFLYGAVMAISQTDAKKILAYSTISNLGLIVTCAGIDTAESLWAAIMLIIFHAVAKSLLFCCVGSTEYLLGSRSVEDMDGLFHLSTQLTMLMIIGIAGMFVAPFGMLISKWAAMKAFLDSGNLLILLIVAFGSTMTLFFWSKWIGKLIANAHRRKPTNYIMRIDEKVSMFTMAAMVIVVCLIHPVISRMLVIPYIDSNMHIHFVSPIDEFSASVIIFMMLMLFIAPLIMIPLFKLKHVDPTSVYLSGENAGDDESFYGSMGKVVKIEMRNWYM